MWKAWNDADTGADVDGGDDDYGYGDGELPLFKRDLVLSWKQLNVTVEKKIPKLFGRAEIVRNQILDNGEWVSNR